MKQADYRLPDFLIIGAMKSGTTGLFMDLCQHPQVFLPDSKEPHCLCDDHVLSDEGLDDYAKLYKGAKPEQKICDASTGYTKLPDHPGVVDRAVQVLPDGFKVIYLVRDPIDRIVSHYRHELQAGLVDAPIDEAVRTDDRYVNYSRYEYQLKAWLDAIGHERIQLIRFEQYQSNRQSVVEAACRFLELQVEQLPEIAEVIYNRSDGKPVARGLWASISRNTTYRNLLRPLISPRMRLTLQRLLVPTSKISEEAPQQSTLDWLREQLRDETQRAEELLRDAMKAENLA